METRETQPADLLLRVPEMGLVRPVGNLGRSGVEVLLVEIESDETVARWDVDTLIHEVHTGNVEVERR